MRKLDYCRVVAQIEKRPDDKVNLTIGEYLQLRAHLAGCDKCRAAVRRVTEAHPEQPHIGPKSEAN